MRPLTKVVLVLAVMAVTAGVLYFASRHWEGKVPGPQAKRPTVTPPADEPRYNDPLAAYERWRDRLTPSPPPGSDRPPPAPPAPAPPRDLVSSSVHEGTVVARRSDSPVAGADPPGPILAPAGVEGEVVTSRWRPREAEARNTHTVVAGDTLYAIALKHYGDPKFIGAIEAANPGVNPQVLRVGDRILLPERDDPSARPPEPPRAKVHVVQKNDTLIGVARRFYGDAAMYRKIYEANKDVLTSPNATLRVGMRLRLPE